MPLSDLPMSVLFIFFLMFFVLIGIYPAWKRSAAKIRKFLEEQTKSLEPLTELFEQPQAEPPLAAQPMAQSLNDFETLVLWQLSQTSGKALSRRQLNETLHLESTTLKQTLESLSQKKLVRVAISSFFGIRFSLSETGHAYAVAKGYIPQIHSNNHQQIKK